MPIALTFLGGADEVGASSTLIEMGGKRILVDAGIRISPRSNRGIQNDQLPDLRPISEVGGPDYILITHAHTDHTGALPLVVEQYPHVPVLATRPTIALTRILQADAQRIMRSKQEQEGELPIFDEVASNRLMEAVQPVEFQQAIRLGEELQVTYHPAGHIAGAAMLVLESGDGVLVMSGDVSLSPQRAVVSAEIPRVKADALVLESTYGGKLHANRLAEERRLIDALVAITERGGKALIPAFALGRAQEVLQIILAYRDRLEVPVYVDGMVRAVCRGYTTFPDLLPPKTVKAAKADNLFFRNKIKAIESNAMREQIAQANSPAVIVASSGMLTGGASVVYAKHMAADERNAILLTGYQDEEAPGRALQRMMREREAGERPTLRIDKERVSVACEIGTYSLSAHADEGELVSMAESFEASEIMLVHGDPGARHSLATALRQRGRRVKSPKIGETVRLAFAPRPWAIGRIQGGGETSPLDPKAVREALKGQAGNFFSASELAQMWWGDTERADEAKTALNGSIYFASDWRRGDTFQVHTAEQAARLQRRRAIMMANPDLVGQLIVLRDSNNRPRVGMVVNAGIEGFEADVHQAKGRHYPGDALLWPLGRWEGYGEGGGRKSQIAALVRDTKGAQDQLLPFSKRQALVAAGTPINPADLLPDPLPEGLTQQYALLAIVLALAGDGATLEAEGLLPKRAREGEPMEQNQAREVAFVTFPPDARLRKVGLEVHRKRLTLTFDFPDMVSSQYAEEIDRVEEQTGWEVRVKPGVNQQALGAAIEELLPENGRIVKGPSYYFDRREVGVELAGVENIKDLEQDYYALTGHRLITSGSNSDSGPAVSTVAQPQTQDRLEINAAYGVIKPALEPLGLYKAGLKQDQIVLTFISPQVGERHHEIITRLANETGYPLTIHPHPNQQKIIQIANSLLRESGWAVRKGPGIHVDRAEIAVSLAEAVDAAQIAALSAQLEEQTGYRFAVN